MNALEITGKVMMTSHPNLYPFVVKAASLGIEEGEQRERKRIVEALRKMMTETDTVDKQMVMAPLFWVADKIEKEEI